MRIMEKEDFRYTWVLPRSAWYIKTYLWVWDADVKDVTFCKLFWGYSLIWIGLPLRLIVGLLRGVRSLGRGFRNELKAHRAQRRAVLPPGAEEKPKPCKPPTISVSRAAAGRRTRFYTRRACGRYYQWDFGDGSHYDGDDPIHVYREPGTYAVTLRTLDRDAAYVTIKKDVVVHAKPSVGVRVLDGVGDGFVAARMGTASVTHGVGTAAKRLGPAVKKLEPAVTVVKPVAKGTWITSVLLSFVVLLAGAVYVIVTSAGSWTSVVADVVTARVGVVEVWEALLLLLAAVFVLYLTIVTGVAVVLGNVFGRPAVRGVKHGSLSFGRMMLIGYKAVKSNTCPRVEVEEEP